METHVPGWETTGGGVQSDAADHAQLARWVRDFEAAEDATRTARALAERDRDYYDGDQLTATERATLERRGQAPLVINRIKRKVDFLLGHERATRTDPKAYPRTMQEQEAAEAATDALRFVCDQQRFDVKRSAVWENLIIEGFGGVEVGAEMNARGEVSPTVTHIPWDRLYYDPHSRRGDFSDARFMGIVLWMDEEEAAERWPDAAEHFRGMCDGAISDTYDDRPGEVAWSDGKRRRVRVCQHYYKRRGVWHLAFYTKGHVLRPAEPVPYVNEDGEPDCPLILQSAYIDRDLHRYGVVREMIGAQDEINKRRSKALHLISVRQTMGDMGAVEDVGAAKRELAKPDGHVVVAPGLRFEVMPSGDMAAAQFQLLQESKAEIDLIGPNAAMQGKDNRAPSGRALLASQQGGQIELGPMTDALRQWQWRVYRSVWNRIRQFWDGPRWIRVTDDERNLRWVGLNQPVTLGERVQQDPEMMAKIQGMREQIAASGDAMAAQQFDAELMAAAQQVVDTSNDVAAMDIDISLQDAPDTVTLAAEQFEQLAQLVGAGLPIPPDILIEASSLRNKDAILERLKAMQEAPQPDPGLVAEQEAKVRKLHADAVRGEAQAAKLGVETGVLMAGGAPGRVMEAPEMVQ